MGEFVKHTACPSCNSSDGFAVYEEDGKPSGGYCYVCEYSESGDNKKSKPKNKPRVKENMTEKIKEKVSKEQTDELKSRTTTKGSGYRGIRDDILATFGVRTEYNEDNEVKAVYYPMTEAGELVGWKPRIHPKTFGGSIGRTGNTCDLFGQFKFKTGGKTCLIVGGEHDQLASYQMLKDYYKSKNWEFEPVVVSPTIGETGCAKQIQAQYEFFSKFEKCIVGMDSDDAGQKAVEKIVKVLPKGRAFVAKWSLKDPNEMLEKGKQRQFISDFYDAKAYVPDGIVASNSLSEKMREELKIPKIPLPPFMHKLQKMMAGGIPLGRIVNMGSASGTGKSTIIDECVYYWIFNSPHMVGIVSLESDSGQYGIKILSRHISNKIELLESEAALDLLETEEIKQKEFELFNTIEGAPRFYLVEERDGGVESLKSVIENMIISIGCKVIILDPLQDVLDSLPWEEQAQFMSWQKGMIKSHKCTFVNVNHVRKSGQEQKANSTGADLHEEDFHGNSAIFKSGACNLLFMRNKEAEDPIERNTTKMKASKIRWTGLTGLAGEYYYDNPTHTMWDKEDWLSQNGVTNVSENKEQNVIEF